MGKKPEPRPYEITEVISLWKLVELWKHFSRGFLYPFSPYQCPHHSFGSMAHITDPCSCTQCRDPICGKACQQKSPPSLGSSRWDPNLSSSHYFHYPPAVLWILDLMSLSYCPSLPGITISPPPLTPASQIPPPVQASARCLLFYNHFCDCYSISEVP